MPNIITKKRLEWRTRFASRFGVHNFDRYLIKKILGYNKDGNRILDELLDFKIEYDLTSDIGKTLFYKGQFEEKEILFFDHLLKQMQSPTILDIGANIGLHSIRWANSAQQAKIFAFEPSPTTRGILEKNIIYNKLSNKIEVVPKAVSEESGTASFYHCEDNAYSSLKDTQRKKVTNVVTVPVTTVDDFVSQKNLTKVDLIKIDVEGFETEVIKGAVNTLKTLKPDLFVEIYGGTNSNKSPEQTIHTIMDLGYKTFVMVEGQLTSWKQHSDRLYNYYFTTRSV